MVPLKVLTLVVAGQNQPSVLVLQPVEETPAGKARIVPIWHWPHRGGTNRDGTGACEVRAAHDP